MLNLDTSQWVEHLSLELFLSALDTERSSGVFKGTFPILPALPAPALAHSSRLAGERGSSQLSLK